MERKTRERAKKTAQLKNIIGKWQRKEGGHGKREKEGGKLKKI